MARAAGASTNPLDAVANARRAMVLGGHPEVTWSILLHVELGEPVDPSTVGRRISRAVADHPFLGPVPEIGSIEPERLAAVRDAFANSAYRTGGPAIRVAVASDPAPALLLAAHHGVLDGLGLIALLGQALDVPLSTSVTGIGDRRSRRSFGRAVVSRLREALLTRPGRIEPAVSTALPGDELAAESVPAVTSGTAWLVAATMRSIQAWNTGRGGSPSPTVVAVAASRRVDQRPTLERCSGYLRLAPPAATERAVRESLAAAAPEPLRPRGQTLRVARPLMRLVAGRLGSTILVSNLGVISGSPNLRSIAFFPAAHGRSGVALGAATVGSRTILTLRGRRRDFDQGALQELIHDIARELAAPGAAERVGPRG